MSCRYGVDTNVLVRLAVEDDGHQLALVRDLLHRLGEDEAFYVNVAAVLELSWVLTKGYGFAPDRVLDFLQAILENRAFELSDYESVGNAIDLCRRTQADFSDALLAELNSAGGCLSTLTFDRKAARRIPAMELIP